MIDLDLILLLIYLVKMEGLILLIINLAQVEAKIYLFKLEGLAPADDLHGLGGRQNLPVQVGRT